jgi:hypothetical protein
MRSSRPSGKLELVKSGEVTVGVARPWDTPQVAYSRWGTVNGRRHWTLPRRLSQPIAVSYQLFRDPAQLADLAERSSRNKSGTAVRGYAEAAGGKLLTEGLTEQRVLGLVRAAANLASLKCIEGPATVRVKLLSQPEPATPLCDHCKRPLGEHVHETREAKGKWVGGRTRDAHYDPEAPNDDHYYYCPEVQA